MAKSNPGGNPNLHWLIGDPFLTEEHWRSLTGDSAVVRLDGRRLDVALLAREIDTLPMFDAHKWIVVLDFRIPSKSAGADEPADADVDRRLLAALGRVRPEVRVILVSELADKRTRLYKQIQQQATCVELPAFREYETARVAEWTAARLKRAGKQIHSSLALELVEAVGTDLGQLSSEIEKLCVAMADDREVNDSHLTVIAGSPLVLRRLVEDGIMKRHTQKSLELLEECLEANEHPLKILNFLIPRFRDLLKASLYPEGRRNHQAAAAVLGNMHPFRLKLLYDDCDRFRPEELRGAMRSLLVADTCLKSSVDDNHVMSLLILALTGGMAHHAFEQTMLSYMEPWD